MKVVETEAKTILVKSKLPDADYVVNPYTGCQFGCLYCYASFMGRYVGEPINSWGEYVYVKTNAVELLGSELSRWSQTQRQATVLLSSVTDPYHGVESKYRLTRGMLEIFMREDYPGEVAILTKSPLVLRDVDILKNLRNTEVGMTVTTTDDRLSRFLEVRAPLASRRLKTLRQLADMGIRTYAFVGPLLPHFRYQPALLEDLFSQLAGAGVQSVYVEHMNLKAYIKDRLWETLQHESQEIQDVYRGASTAEHREALDQLVSALVAKYHLNLMLDEVIYHNKEASQPSEG